MAGATYPRLRTLLDNEFGSGTPATWYVGALLTLPAADGTGFAEPTSGAYARIAITNNTTNFPAAATVSGRTTKSDGTVFLFPTPTADWGLIVGYGLFTVSPINTGVCQYFNPLDTNITVKNGNTPVQFDIGQLVLEFAPSS